MDNFADNLDHIAPPLSSEFTQVIAVILFQFSLQSLDVRNTDWIIREKIRGLEQ